MSFGLHGDTLHTAPHADQHDAQLMVELFRILHSPEMMEDWAWFTTEFNVKTWATLRKKYPPGSEEDMRLRRLLDFWEMVGAFVSHKVLNEALLFDTTRDPIELWARVEPWLKTARKELGPGLWAFIEELAARAAAYIDSRSEDSQA